MTPGRYSEDELVEQPAIRLFEELGWEHIGAYYEKLGPDGTLGRDNRSEVFLTGRLRQAVERLNVGMPREAIALGAAERVLPLRAIPDAILGARKRAPVSRARAWSSRPVK